MLLSYTPPQGEQLPFEQNFEQQADYSGKKFRPTSPKSSYILEINPLLLYRRTLSFQGEFWLGKKFSLGTEVQYLQNKITDNSTQVVRIGYIGIGPQVRFYPLDAMDGVFFGLKLLTGKNDWNILIGSTEAKNSLWIFSPTVNFGYRMTSFSGLTISGYFGGGMNIPEPRILDSDIQQGLNGSFSDTWRRTRSDILNSMTAFRIDMGLTIGVSIE